MALYSVRLSPSHAACEPVPGVDALLGRFLQEHGLHHAVDIGLRLFPGGVVDPGPPGRREGLLRLPDQELQRPELPVVEGRPAGPGSLPCVPDQPAGPLGRLLGDGRSPVFGNPDGVDIHDAGVLDDHLAGAHAHCRRVRRR